MIKPSKILSVAMSMAMVASSAPWASAAAPVAGPAFVQTFTPPTRLGYVVSSFQGKSQQPVVLIQDLHANFGVQKKIVSLLELFQTKTPAGNGMVVGSEAEWGPVDVSHIRNQEPKVRAKASNTLMKVGEIGATAHFAINSKNPIQLMGIEDEADYKLHLNLVRSSIQSRLRLASKVQEAQKNIAIVKTSAPKNLQKVWTAEERYLKGEIGLDQLARSLHMDAISSYSQVEELLLSRKMTLAKEAKKDSALWVNLVQADQYLSLLTRLFRQQMTLEEVQFTAKKMNVILETVQALLPGENMGEWREAIRTAVEYYGVALMRDGPMAENAIKLSESNPNQPIYVVTGGFHTAGIEKILAQKNISYVSIAPVVESHTLKDEMLYLNRILGIRATKQDIAMASSDKSVTGMLASSGKLLKDTDKTTGPAADAAIEAAGGTPAPKAPDTKSGNGNPGEGALFIGFKGQAPEKAVIDKYQAQANGMMPAALAGLGMVDAELLAKYGKSLSSIPVVFEEKPGQEDYTAYTEKDANGVPTRIVLNANFAGALAEIEAKHGAERANSMLLAVLMKEASFLFTTGEADSLGFWFKGLLGMGQGGMQALKDLESVTGVDTVMAGKFVAAFETVQKAFATQRVNVSAKELISTIEMVVTSLIEAGTARYGQKAMFKEAMNTSFVQKLYEPGLMAEVYAAAAQAANKAGNDISADLSAISKLWANPKQQAEMKRRQQEIWLAA